MKKPSWCYDLMIEHVVAGIMDGATFNESLEQFDKSSEIESHEIFRITGKTLADLKKEIQPSLKIEIQERERTYDFLVECVRSGIVDGETFTEAIANYDNHSDDTEPKAQEVIKTANKTLDEFKADVIEYLDIEEHGGSF